MPKRDENYMQGQRDAIAQAALNVLLEKGFYETSLRDICQAAGISNGALYSYFPTREAVIIAACAIDHFQREDSELASTWEEYAAWMTSADFAVGSYASRRIRLSLQFAAELSQMEANPEGLRVVYLDYRENLKRSLLRLQERGIISLPFGIELTTEMHMQIFAGAQYRVASNRDLAPESLTEALVTNLALTAGLIESGPAK